MNKAELLNKKVLRKMRRLNCADFIKHLRRASIDDICQMCDREHDAYALWLRALVMIIKPKQVVELGAAWGNSTIMMSSVMPKHSKLISVDIGNIKPTWGHIDKYYPCLTRILGDDLDLSIYEKHRIDLGKTDIWFIDSWHTAKHFRAELELYSPFFKKGAIVACDDIHLNDMELVWDEIKHDKVDLTYPCRIDSGFGMFIVS